MLQLNRDRTDLDHRTRNVLNELRNLMPHVAVNPLSRASATIRHTSEGDGLFVFDTETGVALSLTVAIVSPDDLILADDDGTWRSLEDIGVVAFGDGRWSKCVSFEDDVHDLSWVIQNPPALEENMTRKFIEAVTLHLEEKHHATIVSIDESGVPSILIDRSARQ